MKTKIKLIWLLMVASSANLIASDFEIARVFKDKEYIWVDERWEQRAPCVKAKIRSQKKMEGSAATIKAYFYDENMQLVETAKNPSSFFVRTEGTSSRPALFKPKKSYEVFFGVPAVIRKGEGKWKYVVVVFGQGKDLVVKSYPAADISQFDFPEKKRAVSSE